MMELVKFKDDQYGIRRKFLFWYQFAALYKDGPECGWYFESTHSFCRTIYPDLAKNKLDRILAGKKKPEKDIGEPIGTS